MFKLAPAAQDFSICMRCQCRLSLAKTARTTRRRPLQAKGPTPSQYRAFASHAPLRYEHVQGTARDGAIPTPRVVRYERVDGEPPPPPPKTPLGIESLGEPAEVLVLRGARKGVRNLGVLFTEEAAKPLPTSLEGTSEALLHGIEAERGIIDVDQVCANIDRVRDAFLKSRRDKTSNLSAGEYEELLSKLLSGFEKKHLAEYWRRSGSTASMDALNLHFPFSSDSFARSTWSTNITSLDQTKAPLLMKAGAISKGATRGRLSFKDRGKHWHAENIVQRCWGIYSQKVDAIGQVALRMPHTHLGLLLNHANDPVKKLSQSYSVKIEASHSLGVIRIESDYSTSEDLVRMFIHILENIKHVSVAVGSSIAKAGKTAVTGLDEGYLREVERLTNTVISKPSRGRSSSSSSREYTVFFLGPDESDLEDARRLLDVESQTNMSKDAGDIFVHAPMDLTISATPIDVGESLPLAARSIQWARFAGPNARQSEKDAEAKPLAIGHPSETFAKADLVVDQVTALLMERQASDINTNGQEFSHQYWSEKLSLSSRVTLGQLAFPLQQAKKADTRPRTAKTRLTSIGDGIQHSAATLPRAFITTVPGMTRALGANAQGLLPGEHLQIRMIPTCSLPSPFKERVPQLELMIGLDPKARMVALNKARLVVVHEELDLLLPAHTTDLRFARRAYLYSDRGNFDPNLLAFVNASVLDVWGAERLKTPNHLQLSIPADSIPGIERLDDSLVGQLLPIKYTFASLEHRSDVKFHHSNMNKSTYTTIEAGRTGGRREELTISLGSSMPSQDSRHSGKREKRKSAGREILETAKQNAKSLLEAAATMIKVIETPQPSERPMLEIVHGMDATEPV